MINQGKRFENNFKLSVPEGVFFYRLRDSASSYYGGNSNLRFSNKNIADNIIFTNNTLFINELKAHKGKSIPLSCIRESQVEMMLKASHYEGVKCTLFVFFYDICKCYALNIKDFQLFLENSSRKSIPISYFQEKGLEIPVKQLSVNHRFLLKNFLK